MTTQPTLQETEAQLASELERTAPGGEHLTMPDKSMIRNYVLQRNVQIQRELDRTLTPDDRVMVEFAKQLAEALGQALVQEPHAHPEVLARLGDFVVLNRRNGFYELEAYNVVPNPNNATPTTKRVATWNVNAILSGRVNNPFSYVKEVESEAVADSLSQVPTIANLVDITPLSTLGNVRTDGLLQSVTIGVYNVMLALRAKRWSVVTLCPDASEIRSYKPLLISHPFPSLGLNGLLSHCQNNTLSTRSRKDFLSYQQTVAETA